MSDLEKSFRELSKTENVFLFVPNLIGYGRIFLALLSFWFMPTNYVAAAWCYIISGELTYSMTYDHDHCLQDCWTLLMVTPLVCLDRAANSEPCWTC